MVVIKRFLIGFTVFSLNSIVVLLILCGVGALDLNRKLEFFAFAIPVIYITMISCFFLIRVKC